MEPQGESINTQRGFWFPVVGKENQNAEAGSVRGGLRDDDIVCHKRPLYKLAAAGSSGVFTEQERIWKS